MLIVGLVSFIGVMVIPEVSLGQVFAIEEVAQGVYAVIGGEGDANAGFIIGEDGVMVIDSQVTPARARALLNRISGLTDQPIRYLVNTHYHGDHIQGNQAFSSETVIIGHERTRYNLLQLHRSRLQGLRDQTRRALREAVPESIEALKTRLVELEGLEIVPPTLTFRDQLTLHGTGRRIEFLHLGPAHTDGDIVVFLPEEKVLFTGDLVFYQALPWLGDAFIQGWVESLEQLAAMEVETVVPGHGPVAGRRAILGQIRYLKDLQAAVAEALRQGLDLEAAKASIRLLQYKDWWFYEMFREPNIEQAFREMEGTG